jgi:hypothetical protein
MTRKIMALGLALAMGCGSSTGGGPSGVSGTKQVSSVTDSEKGMLCDWFVAMVGGYGAIPTCDMAPLDAPPDKAECIAGFPVCPVPVSTFEICITALVASGRTCTVEAINEAMAKPECQAVGSGGCFSNAP